MIPALPPKVFHARRVLLVVSPFSISMATRCTLLSPMFSSWGWGMMEYRLGVEREQGIGFSRVRGNLLEKLWELGHKKGLFAIFPPPSLGEPMVEPACKQALTRFARQSKQAHTCKRSPASGCAPPRQEEDRTLLHDRTKPNRNQTKAVTKLQGIPYNFVRESPLDDNGLSGRLNGVQSNCSGARAGAAPAGCVPLGGLFDN